MGNQGSRLYRAIDGGDSRGVSKSLNQKSGWRCHYGKAWHASIKGVIYGKTYCLPVRRLFSKTEVATSKKTARKTRRHFSSTSAPSSSGTTHPKPLSLRALKDIQVSTLESHRVLQLQRVTTRLGGNCCAVFDLGMT